MQRPAWLLTLSNHNTLAIAQQQVVEYSTGLSAHHVPDCSFQCHHVVLWRNTVLPIIGIGSKNAINNVPHLLVISYVHSLGNGLIALSLTQPPQAINVSDQDQCSPQDEQVEYWQGAVAACFQHDENVIPIVDFGKLISPS
ncbi:chemotaxis protein CheW [Ketobacter sp.]